MEYEPENEKIYFNLGMLTMDDRQYTDSEKWFQKSIKVNRPMFLRALKRFVPFNLVVQIQYK